MIPFKIFEPNQLDRLEFSQEMYSISLLLNTRSKKEREIEPYNNQSLQTHPDKFMLTSSFTDWKLLSSSENDKRRNNDNYIFDFGSTWSIFNKMCFKRKLLTNILLCI